MPDFLVFTTIIPKLLGTKILLDLHEPTPELWITKFGADRFPWLLYLQIKIEQLAIKYADYCLTVTNALRHRLAERGADINKITVIPNVCEERFEDVFSSKFKERKVFPEGKFCLVTHGLIEERSGHELVVKAVNALQGKISNLEYKILGEGEYVRNLCNLVHKLKCDEIVHFLGFLPFNKMLKTILEADVGIIPMKRSPYSELIDTNKMYEYIALRKPIIISRLKAVEENFDDSCFMYFEPGNPDDLAICIFELYNNPEMKNNLIENAYRKYEKIRWHKTKIKYLKVFQELI